MLSKLTAISRRELRLFCLSYRTTWRSGISYIYFCFRICSSCRCTHYSVVKQNFSRFFYQFPVARADTHISTRSTEHEHILRLLFKSTSKKQRKISQQNKSSSNENESVMNRVVALAVLVYTYAHACMGILLYKYGLWMSCSFVLVAALPAERHESPVPYLGDAHRCGRETFVLTLPCASSAHPVLHHVLHHVIIQMTQHPSVRI